MGWIIATAGAIVAVVFSDHDEVRAPMRIDLTELNCLKFIG
jgi:hypothetical protein